MRRSPRAVACTTAARIAAGVTRRRSLSSTKKVSVPVSWQSGVACARASRQLARIVFRTTAAELPRASRRSAARSARSVSSGSEELVCRISSANLSTVFIVGR